MNAKIMIIYFILYSLISSTGIAQDHAEEQLQKVLDSGINRYKVHGVSAAVIFPDNTIWKGVSGVSHDTVSMKPDMLFGVGSITKNFVAALILKLVENKILALDDPLSKWLPSYQHVDGMITIRQLMNHTSGLYMFWDNEEIWDELKQDRAKVWKPEEVLRYIRKPYFSAGEGWHYSNTNYLLLAMIIEKATGTKLSTMFREYFWQDLDIENAYLSIEDTIPDNQAHVYGDNFQFGEKEADVTFLPRASHESIIYGSGGLFMTAEDLARWCHSLFEGKVLQQQSMDEMLQFVEISPVSNMRAYGLGVQVYQRDFSNRKEAIGHGGGNIGTAAYMVYLPDYHLSIVVMVNAFPTGSVDYITKGLIRNLTGKTKLLGWIPAIRFFPHGLLMLCATISFITILILRIKKRQKMLI